MKISSTFQFFDKELSSESLSCGSDEITVEANNGTAFKVQRFTLQVRATSSVDIENKIVECKKILEEETNTTALFIPWSTNKSSYEEVKGIKGCP